MSDTSQGPGWWLASDGRWYPPEQWTGPPAAGTPPMVQSGAGVGAPPAGVGMPSGPYPPEYPGWSYGQDPQYEHGPVRRANGLAVASLVCAIGGFVFFVPAILGIILGFVARSQIRQSGGTQSGDGLAVAGIIIGFAWVLLLAVVFVVSASNTNSSGVVFGQQLVAVGSHNS